MVKFSTVETKMNEKLKGMGFKLSNDRYFRFIKTSNNGQITLGVSYANRDDGDGAERRFYINSEDHVTSDVLLTYNIVLYDNLHNCSIASQTSTFKNTTGKDDISTSFFNTLQKYIDKLNSYN